MTENEFTQVSSHKALLSNNAVWLNSEDARRDEKKKKVDISHQRSLHLAEGMSHIGGDLKKKKNVKNKFKKGNA